VLAQESLKHCYLCHRASRMSGKNVHLPGPFGTGTDVKRRIHKSTGGSASLKQHSRFVGLSSDDEDEKAALGFYCIPIFFLTAAPPPYYQSSGDADSVAIRTQFSLCFVQTLRVSSNLSPVNVLRVSQCSSIYITAKCSEPQTAASPCYRQRVTFSLPFGSIQIVSSRFRGRSWKQRSVLFDVEYENFELCKLHL